MSDDKKNLANNVEGEDKQVQPKKKLPPAILWLIVGALIIVFIADFLMFLFGIIEWQQFLIVIILYLLILPINFFVLYMGNREARLEDKIRELERAKLEEDNEEKSEYDE